MFSFYASSFSIPKNADLEKKQNLNIRHNEKL